MRSPRPNEPAPWSLYLRFLGNKLFLSFGHSLALVMGTLVYLATTNMPQINLSLGTIAVINLIFLAITSVVFALYLIFLIYVLVIRGLRFSTKACLALGGIITGIAISLGFAIFFYIYAADNADNSSNQNSVFTIVFFISLPFLVTAPIISYSGAFYLTILWEKTELVRFKAKQAVAAAKPEPTPQTAN